MFENLISQRVAQLRMQHGISARDMSLSLGQSDSYINKIENGNANPSIQGLYLICEFLHIHPKDFFDTDVAAPEQANALSDKLKRLSPEQIRSVEALIDSFSK